MIAGNKSDMENQRRVPKKEAEDFANSCNTKHYLVSAKNGSNINELFMDLAETIYEVKKNNDKNVIGGKGRNPRIKIENMSTQKNAQTAKKK